MTNDFLPVRNYEGYLINKNGIVISLSKKVWNGNGYFIRPQRILKHSSMPNGYIAIHLTKNKKTKSFYLHRLLALNFIPNPHNKRQINHKDGNKLNNSLTNLEWVTSTENIRHAFKNKLIVIKPRYGLQNSFGKFSNKTIDTIKKLKGTKTLSNIAKDFNMSITHVWAIQNNKTRTGGGNYDTR